MWSSGSPSRQRLSARDYCDGVDGKAFWPATGDQYYLDSAVLVSWFAGKASGYTNTTAALWDVWLQDAAYADDGAAKGGFRDVVYSRNFTYTVEGDNWWWVPTDVCNQTVVSCMWTVPRDFRGATGSYVMVAVREAAATMSASTATSGPFTIVASSNPTVSAAAATATPASSAASTGASGASGLPAETAAASSAAGDSRSMSPGAVAGIACGAVVVLLAVAGLLWFFWRRRRNKKRDAAARADAAGRSSGYEKPELDGQGVAVVKKDGVELDGKLIHVAELDGQQTWENDGVSAAAAATTSKVEKSNVRVEASPTAELGAG